MQLLAAARGRAAPSKTAAPALGSAGGAVERGSGWAHGVASVLRGIEDVALLRDGGL